MHEEKPAARAEFFGSDDVGIIMCKFCDATCNADDVENQTSVRLCDRDPFLQKVILSVIWRKQRRKRKAHVRRT